MRQIVLTRGENGYWVAECPSLPGCISQGQSRQEAIANIREAIQAYIAALEEDRLPVPEDHFDTVLIAVRANSRGFPGGNVSKRSRPPVLPRSDSKGATSS